MMGHRTPTMRTTIVIDDALIAETLLRESRQAEIHRLLGALTWSGDLDAMRGALG